MARARSLLKAGAGGLDGRERSDEAVEGLLRGGGQAQDDVLGQHLGEHQRKVCAHALAERHLAERQVDAPQQPRRAADVRQHLLHCLTTK